MPRKRGYKRPRPPVGDTLDPESLWHHLLRYLAFLEERQYSEHTVKTRENCLRYFIAWCFERGVMRPQQLDRPILERYQRHLFYYRKKDGDPLTTATQQGRIIPIRHWLQWLVKQRHLLYSPAADLDMPRREHRLPKAILSAKEAETVVAVPNVRTALGLRDRAILETLYSTGIRRAEVIGLNVRDVDFERGTVMIRLGKGRKDRMIPIGERALAWIAAYRDGVRPGFVAGHDDGTLFLSTTGRPIMPTHLTGLVMDYVDKAAIGKKGSCHLFRHTVATLMLENGADIRFIQAMLGHAELSTTQIYTQVSIRQLKAIHSATHPARLPEAVLRKLETEDPTVEDLLFQLGMEAMEDGEN